MTIHFVWYLFTPQILSFAVQKVSDFMKPNCQLWELCFLTMSMSWTVSHKALVFFFILGFKWTSLIHFELIFVHGEIYGSNFIVLLLDIGWIYCLIFIPTDRNKYQIQFNYLLFVSNGDHSRNPQQINLQRITYYWEINPN